MSYLNAIKNVYSAAFRPAIHKKQYVWKGSFSPSPSTCLHIKLRVLLGLSPSKGDHVQPLKWVAS